jgi:hypothetical protein
MTESEKKIIGVLAIIVGAAIIAPRETLFVLDEIQKPRKKEVEKPNEPTSQITINAPANAPIEELGLVRRMKKNIIFTINKFWKWFY